jgi:hypothetical protein
MVLLNIAMQVIISKNLIKKREKLDSLVFTFKLLDLILCNRLSWQPHIKTVDNKRSRLLPLL